MGVVSSLQASLFVSLGSLLSTLILSQPALPTAAIRLDTALSIFGSVFVASNPGPQGMSLAQARSIATMSGTLLPHQ